MSILRFATWNMMNFGRNAHRRPGNTEPRLELAAQTLTALRIDAAAIQEFCGWDRLLTDLAHAAGMSAYTKHPWHTEDDISDGAVALQKGTPGYGVALMWRPPALRLVEGTDRRYGAGEFWHGLIHGRLRHTDDEGADVDMVFGSYHAPPTQRGRRRDEAELLVARMSNPHPRSHPSAPPSEAPQVLIGGDWNCIGEDPELDADPYAELPWTPKHVHWCDWEADSSGDPARWWADRGPSQILHAGGLIDAARAVRTGQTEPTVGHHAQDPDPRRRLDTVRVSRPVLAAVTDFEVIDSTTPGVPEGLEEHFDHKPVVIEIDTDLLRAA